MKVYYFQRPIPNIMTKCPMCKKSYATNPACGLRLFNSENECAICLEKKPVMLALPCGHQFCQEDLQRIGIQPIAEPIASSRPTVNNRPNRPRQRNPPRRRPRLPIIRPMRVIDLTRRRATKRCGWCGHLGHTIRKCAEHRHQCNCTSLKTVRHKRLHRRKHRCRMCGKKGHRVITCTTVVR